MIGPDDYDEFVHNQLEEEAKYFNRTFYHLDGKGQIKHLDKILSIEEFNGIQWVHGAGEKPIHAPEWSEIYKKVLSSGKLLELTVNEEDLPGIDSVVETVGSPKGIAFIVEGTIDQKDEMIELLNRYNVPI